MGKQKYYYSFAFHLLSILVLVCAMHAATVEAGRGRVLGSRQQTIGFVRPTAPIANQIHQHP